MKKKNLKEKLLYVANKCFCAYTYDRAVNEYSKIRHLLSEDQNVIIKQYLGQIGNPDNSPSGHGHSDDYDYQHSCVGLKKYIESDFTKVTGIYVHKYSQDYQSLTDILKKYKES